MSNEQDVDHFMVLLSGENAADDELGMFAIGLRQYLNQKRGEQLAAALFEGAPHTALSSERVAAEILAAEIGPRELLEAAPAGEAANDAHWEVLVESPTWRLAAADDSAARRDVFPLEGGGEVKLAYGLNALPEDAPSGIVARCPTGMEAACEGATLRLKGLAYDLAIFDAGGYARNLDLPDWVRVRLRDGYGFQIGKPNQKS